MFTDSVNRGQALMYQKEIVVTLIRDFRENLFLLKIMTPWKVKGNGEGIIIYYLAAQSCLTLL